MTNKSRNTVFKFSNIVKGNNSVVNDLELSNDSIASVKDKQYIRGSFDTVFNVEINGSIYQFSFQENDFYFKAHGGNIGEERFASFLINNFCSESDSDDYEEKITEITSLFIEKAKAVFDLRLENIKRDLIAHLRNSR